MDNIEYDNKPKLTIGFIQLPSDITTDSEIPFILFQIKNICWRMQKLSFENNDFRITLKTYKNSIKNIKNAASTFIPIDNKCYGSIDIIVLACTSMSFSLGPSKVQEELLKGYPNALIATDTATAIISALKYLKENCKIGLLTPYISELHQKNIDFLIENNFNVVSDYNLNLDNDAKITSINPQTIIKYIELMNIKDIDVILLSCNALRTTGYGFIDYMEKKFNRPVITSNQALVWHCLHKCSKIDKKDIKNIKGYGSLFNK